MCSNTVRPEKGLGEKKKEMRKNWELENIYTCPVIFSQSADFSKKIATLF